VRFATGSSGAPEREAARIPHAARASPWYPARVQNRLRCQRLAPLAAAALVAFSASTARADVSSFLFVGAGPSLLNRSGASNDVKASLDLDAGLGMPPSYPVVVGGLLRMQTRFGNGSDFAALVRTATGGFVRGDWGAALDLGAYERTWGHTGPGFEGSLSLGAPWGITAMVSAQVGAGDERTFAAVLGIDFARFTIYRSTGLGWWPNPYPSPRPEH
jgi:hypothetical protein